MNAHIYDEAAPVLRYIPIAIYIVGCCYSGCAKPYRTVKIAADNLQQAREKGWKELKPDTTEHICIVSVSPNPEHIEMEKQSRDYFDKMEKEATPFNPELTIASLSLGAHQCLSQNEENLKTIKNKYGNLTELLNEVIECTEFLGRYWINSVNKKSTDFYYEEIVRPFGYGYVAEILRNEKVDRQKLLSTVINAADLKKRISENSKKA